MCGKLHSSRGETLVETLAAILIASLSVALLFTCIMASVRMGESARRVDEAHYKAFSDAEAQSNVATPGEGVTPQVKVDGNSASQTIDINLYGGAGMYSYKAKEVTPP